MKVKEACIRLYNVGFGDCVLLRLTYDDPAESIRSLLFDFGSTQQPPGAKKDHMERIATNIRSFSGGKLHVVVATHRHADHISGFGHSAAGPIIESLEPEIVVQPWTEHPDLPIDALAPVDGSGAARLNLAGTLTNMQAFAAGAHRESVRLKNVTGFPKSVAERLSFLGEMNLSNPAAVTRLMNLGKKRVYVSYGDTLDLEDVLPGVSLEVLGPPTLEQSPAIARQTSKHATEFWHLAAAWGRAAAKGVAPPPGADAGPAAALPLLFPEAEEKVLPQAARWLVPRVTRAHADSMLAILRTMDDVLNNTSLILLLRIGDTSMLFPGDAQIENWSYALFDAPDSAEVRAKLARTNVYKVGHHGSLNATPKTLWNGFSNKRPASPKDDIRLISVLSSRRGKHGDTRNDTEVPRIPLLEALRLQSTLVTTLDSRRVVEPWMDDVKIPLR